MPFRGFFCWGGGGVLGFLGALWVFVEGFRVFVGGVSGLGPLGFECLGLESSGFTNSAPRVEGVQNLGVLKRGY